MFRVLVFLVGLVLSGVAAFYSVTGLALVFAGAFWPVVIMGGALEAAKVVGASWVFRSWRSASKLLVAYMTVGVLLLMGITGLGIFGYLTRAYLTQQAPIATLAAEQAAAERRVALAKEQYERDARALLDLSSGQTADKVVNQLATANRLSGRNGAVSVLRTQQTLQNDARSRLDASGRGLRDAEREYAEVSQRMQLQTVDVGPLMFAAKAYYGTSDLATMDRVVTWFIGILLVVFDPMAIALLLAAQSGIGVSASRRDVMLDMEFPFGKNMTSIPISDPTNFPFGNTSTTESLWTSTTPESTAQTTPLPSFVDSPDLYDTRFPSDKATFEPATVVMANTDSEPPLSSIDTETIGAPIIGTLPVERPTSRRRSRTAPKRP